MQKLYKILSLTLLSMLVFYGCNENISDPELVSSDQNSLNKGKIMHHVSVGGPDIDLVGPGGDANFSLVANMDANGNVKGQWQDKFGDGAGNIHVAVDCLEIFGNSAIVGGIITHGTVLGEDVSGQRAVTLVVDNGKSKKDPVDQISFSFFGEDIQGCGAYSPGLFPLEDFTRGQVTVR
jgi:hypothetical protein